MIAPSPPRRLAGRRSAGRGCLHLHVPVPLASNHRLAWGFTPRSAKYVYLCLFVSQHNRTATSPRSAKDTLLDPNPKPTRSRLASRATDSHTIEAPQKSRGPRV